MTLLVYLGLLVLTSFILRRFLAPYLLSRLTPIRIKSISLRNIRGLEWHPRRRTDSTTTLAPLRVERIGWEWCAKEHWGITVVVEQIELSFDHDLEQLGQMTQSAGKDHGPDSVQASQLVS